MSSKQIKCTRIFTNYILYSNGKVLNEKTGTYLNGYLDKDGYRIVNLKGKHLKVHRLVVIHFIPNPHNLPEVNHKDFDRTNCDESNLEWTTHADNIRHSRDNYAKTFTFLSPTGEVHTLHNLRKWCEDKPHLCRHSMAKLHRGALKTYKGWTKYVKC